VKLYYFVGACSLADHIVLEWIGAPHEAVRMTHESIRSPEYLALNPNGTVPMLIHGDFVLTQNAAILTYLADLHPEMHLLGDGSARARAEVTRWLAFLNSDVHPAFKPIFVPARFLAEPAYAGAIQDKARDQVSGYLGQIDRWMEGRDWLTDERSIADPYLFVMLRWATRLNVPVDGLPNLSRFAARMYADNGVRRAIAAEEDVMEESSPGFQHERLYADLHSRVGLLM
jgi:glutathione S-transferase